MMLPSEWSIVIAAISLETVILSAAVGVVWKLARSEMALRAEFNKQLADIQAKVYQVEIWSRDEFVRKGSFELVVARLEKSMETLAGKIEAAVDKIMAVRIEKITQQHDR